MNQRQKELIQLQLNDEKEIVKELKQIYEKAREDVVSSIKALEARTDYQNLSSIVYQKQYQESIKKQLDSILDMMNANQFDSISDYLTKCYENGFIGVQYDLQGQGVPFIFPIDQKQVSNAVQIDSKISEGLYQRLGVNTKELKKSIRQNVSRGIASNLPWLAVAQNIDRQMNIGANKSIRIARTEGHRIQNEAAYNAQKKAKEKGADVVKQWDSTLDGKTRPHHRQLDGQIRDIDEPFEIDGQTAMYPGGFGIASEDVNCRCASLQRATWELEDGFTKYDNFTKELRSFNSPKDYDEFKKWYWSDENLSYMQYIDGLEKKYETKYFRALLENMSDDEYKEFHKLELQSPLWNAKKREVLLDSSKDGYYNVLKEAVKSGDVKLEVNRENQNRHILSSKDYKEGRSYIYGDLDFAERLIYTLSGTGSFISNDEYVWSKRELVEANEIIGAVIDLETGEIIKTNKATIHYSNTGTHIVPRKGYK